jgi:Tol biopolymer transport system component
VVFVSNNPTAMAQFYNGTNTGFGKNRVQFKTYEWKYYRFDNYETYFYTGGNELAVYTSKIAKDLIADQEDFFDFDLKEKIQFIIYNKQSDFKQSNIGLSLENGEIGGVTQIMGSKVFLYFNGNHADFDKQIKAGIAQVLINQQVYGASWGQVVKNSSLLNLPEWYIEGLTSYISEPWNPEIENQVRDGIQSGRYQKFNRLNPQEANVAGHSMWAYIANTYGDNVIPNILYMTRLTQSVDRGFLYVLGISLKTLQKDWVEYYKQDYSNLPDNSLVYKEYEKLKIRKRREYKQFKVSPDGQAFAYVTDQLGQYKIYVTYLSSTKKKYKIYKREYKMYRINDKTYPVLTWHPSSEILAFLTEEKGLLMMHFFDINSGGIDVKALFNLEKVTDMAYSSDGKQMIFSGVFKGQSDLFLYNVAANSHKNLTQDIYDDLNPQFIDNSSKIVFSSNRTNDTLSTKAKNQEFGNSKQFDIWVLDHTSEEKTLFQVTTTKGSEFQPYGVDSAIYYLGVKNGIYNRYHAVKDSFITNIDTTIHYHRFYEAKPSEQNNSRGISEQSINPLGNFTELILDNYKYHLLSKDYSKILTPYPQIDTTIPAKAGTTQKEIDTLNTAFSTQNTSTPVILFNTISLTKDTVVETVNIDKYVFEKEKEKLVKRTYVFGDKNNAKDTLIKAFKLPNQRNYNLSFFNDNSSLKLSNSFVNQEYQLFTGGPFTGPDIGGVLKLGVVDLFEDYKLFGGARVSSGSTEYFMTLQNYSQRRDKEYTFARSSTDATNGFDIFDVTSNILKYSIKYPFSEVAALQFSSGVRNDVIVVKSIDRVSLLAENLNEYRGVLKAAYVFDNSLPKMLNIYYGTKFKVFAEYYQEAFDKKDGENGNTQIVGFDLRHSLKLSRELIWVNRIAASSSLGKEKLIYYLGSLDNWFDQFSNASRFINQEDINNTINYRYQALASNLRGFPQNIRRGSNFAVVNSEVRFPIFSYFIRRPIRSSFIKDFQLIGFTDAGMAWDGLDPFSDENRLTKEIYNDGPLTVVIFKDSYPIVGGYGFGARTSVLGYFLRADWAWGVENGVSADKPIFYLSLSLDI